MRIGLDLLPLQTEDSRGRGIGRFADRLARALLARPRGHEVVLYAHEGLDDSGPRRLPGPIVELPRPSRTGRSPRRTALEDRLNRNPERLDALLLLSPFELCPDYEPPARPLAGPLIAAVVHDLIPFLFPDRYLADPPNAVRFRKRLQTLKGYDRLLTISDCTRDDVIRLTGRPPATVATIGGAADAATFFADRSDRAIAEARGRLAALGIDRPYVFHLASRDDRKNLPGLLRAFGMLPGSLRDRHRLVVCGRLGDGYGAHARRLAAAAGVDDVAWIGGVDDDTLRMLYQHCAAFAFPSLYEGLGLPLLEAMHCGAAVIAGANSSQPEVVGDAGLLVDAQEPRAIAEGLRRLLAEPGLADELGRRAEIRAAGFTWEKAAGRALDSLEEAHAERSRPGRRPRPRLAMFSPYPPKGSGIADYATRLIRALDGRYAIDLYHESGYVPEPGLGTWRHACYDHRLYDRNAALAAYRGVVYHMGNSFYHKFIYEAILRHPGVVVLHDYSLSAFQFWFGSLAGAPPGHFEGELRRHDPANAEDHLSRLDEWHREPGGMQVATTRRGLYLNRRVFEASTAVIVHSPWCREQVAAQFPEHLGKTVVIPHGASATTIAPGRRDEVRRRYDLPLGALVFGSFGILSKGKMNVEALDAFAEVARARPDAMLIFVGADWERGEARSRACSLGLIDRVRFLGRRDDDEFEALMGAVDVGINLRLPPTNGETSGALLHLLRHGVPTVVTDVGTFGDYPDGVVRKVRWESEGPAGLARAWLELANDPAGRAALGESARRYVAARHSWADQAERYVEVIERVAGARGLATAS